MPLHPPCVAIVLGPLARSRHGLPDLRGGKRPRRQFGIAKTDLDLD